MANPCIITRQSIQMLKQQKTTHRSFSFSASTSRGGLSISALLDKNETVFLLSLNSLLILIVMFTGNTGRPVAVINGTKIALWLERIKSLLVIYLERVWSENNKSTRLLLTSANATIVNMEDGVMSQDHNDAKNAITTFRVIYSNVGSVESWLIINTEETDYKELVWLYYIATTKKLLS